MGIYTDILYCSLDDYKLSPELRTYYSSPSQVTGDSGVVELVIGPDCEEITADVIKPGQEKRND